MNIIIHGHINLFEVSIQPYLRYDRSFRHIRCMLEVLVYAHVFIIAVFGQLYVTKLIVFCSL